MNILQTHYIEQNEVFNNNVREAQTRSIYNIAITSGIFLLFMLLFVNIYFAGMFTLFVKFIAAVSGLCVSLFTSESYEIAFDHIYTLLGTTESAYVFHIIISVITTTLPFLYLMKKAGLKFTDGFKVNINMPKKFWLYVPFTLGAGYIVNLIIHFLFDDMLERFTAPQALLPSNPTGIVLYYVLLAFIPAIFEEWAFRGILLRSLLPYGKGFALIVSSVLFGLMHISPPQVIFATTFGLLSGFLYIKTGTIWYGVLIHLINNAYSATNGFVLFFKGEESIEVILLSIITLLIIITAIIGIIYFSRSGYFRVNLLHYVNPPDKPRLSFSQYFNLSLINGFTLFFIVLYSVVLWLEYFY